MKLILIFAFSTLFTKAHSRCDPWLEYKNQFNINYENDTELEKKQYENFKYNDEKIIEHNSQLNKTYLMAHNEFSILSEEEFKKLYLTKISKSTQNVQASVQADLTPSSFPTGPDSISYAAYAFPARKQGQCGSCWAFATSAQVETVLKRRSPAYETYLSTQYLLDCAQNTGCGGGGNPNVAFTYLKSNGLVAEPNYPYLDVQGTCSKNVLKMSQRINNITHFDLNANEQQLANIVASVGPIVVSMYAQPISLQLYSRGIYFDPFCPNTCKSANHAVLVVGYGTDNRTFPGFPIDYWIVKNSWGSSWGESNGYFRMIRNYNGLNNNCNIACSVDYST